MGSFLVDLNDGWREWAFPLLYFHTRFPFPVLLNESITDSESECTPEGFLPGYVVFSLINIFCCYWNNILVKQKQFCENSGVGW